MKIVILTIAIILGVIINPKEIMSFGYLQIVFFFILGLLIPYLIDKFSLKNNVDITKVTFKDDIQVNKLNTLVFWLGIFFITLSFSIFMCNLYFIQNEQIIVFISSLFSLGLGMMIAVFKF